MRKALAASLLVALLTCSAHAGVLVGDRTSPPPPPPPAEADGIIQNGSPDEEADGWIGTGFASVEFVLKGFVTFI